MAIGCRADGGGSGGGGREGSKEITNPAVCGGCGGEKLMSVFPRDTYCGGDVLDEDGWGGAGRVGRML